MTQSVPGSTSTWVGQGDGVNVTEAAAHDVGEVFDRLKSSRAGLAASDAAERLARAGPNAVRTHHAQALRVLARQLRSAVLVLLAVTAVASYFLGERTDAIIIGVILSASIGLGFFNEFRAERAAEALHSQVHHQVVVERDGASMEVDVTELVPGDVVHVSLGVVVPADMRLIEASGLECDESVLTGESMPVDKNTGTVAANAAMAELSCCALMGTVVHAGSGIGVVVATGGRAEFGRIALGLGERQPETDFQVGLRKFSMLLLQVAAALTVGILVTNLILHRPFIDSVLFSLAIAVGVTPQLLPAVVSSSLATGSRQLVKHKVLVKRLVCIEDLGDMNVLVTDKTGTLTEGRITFTDAIDGAGVADERVQLLGLLATEHSRKQRATKVLGVNPLDAALWESPGALAEPVGTYTELGLVSFDHDRMMTTALVRGADGQVLIITKGAPESVLSRCVGVSDEARATLQAKFESGARVVAVATRVASDLTAVTAAEEHDLTLAGFLVFLDRPKPAAAGALTRLRELGISVKIATGDNPIVAEKVCADLGLHSGGTLVGTDIEGMDDVALAAAAIRATIFARVSPEQKARLIRALRSKGGAVGFLGDGVNDALALHTADVGISVDTAADVAKDAADIVLLEKDLAVLAEGVVVGRRIFANTIKYVLMGTSSNFGNMFSAAAASAFLKFLPMLPSQILLNNLLYDTCQLTIPTDNVDEEQLEAPSHWDISFIRRFMLYFGPISSVFDFVTFGVMLWVFHAGPSLFRSGWFVESLATQSLIVFAIRTRRVPFVRSRPSVPLLVSAIGVVVVGASLPMSPLAKPLGFSALPLGFFAALVGMVVAYLVLIEFAKKRFYASMELVPPDAGRRLGAHNLHRRAARFSHGGPLSGGEPLGAAAPGDSIRR